MFGAGPEEQETEIQSDRVEVPGEFLGGLFYLERRLKNAHLTQRRQRGGHAHFKAEAVLPSSAQHHLSKAR